MMGTLLALACAAMMAAMCIPMAIGMIRSRLRRRSNAQAAGVTAHAARDE